jgi:hypothetical protein
MRLQESSEKADSEETATKASGEAVHGAQDNSVARDICKLAAEINQYGSLV